LKIKTSKIFKKYIVSPKLQLLHGDVVGMEVTVHKVPRMGLGRGTKWWDMRGRKGAGTGLAWWMGMEMGGYDNK